MGWQRDGKGWQPNPPAAAPHAIDPAAHPAPEAAVAQLIQGMQQSQEQQMTAMMQTLLMTVQHLAAPPAAVAAPPAAEINPAAFAAAMAAFMQQQQAANPTGKPTEAKPEDDKELLCLYFLEVQQPFYGLYAFMTHRSCTGLRVCIPIHEALVPH